jgi:hypothetical protein
MLLLQLMLLLQPMLQLQPMMMLLSFLAYVEVIGVCYFLNINDVIVVTYAVVATNDDVAVISCIC